MTDTSTFTTTLRLAARRASGLSAIVTLVTLAACGDMAADAESDLLMTDGGDVELPVTHAVGLDYTVTSQDYRRWLAAESALAAVGARDLSDRIPLEAVSEEAIEQVAETLEEDEEIRRAIEGAGLSVSRYVHTTVALEQALAAASPDSRVQFRQLPAENIIVADRYAADIERIRTASPLRIVESERTARYRDRADRPGKKKARGKAKGHRKGKGKDKD